MSDSTAGTKTESRAVSQGVPSSLHVIAAIGNQRNALVMYEVSTEGGPIGSKVFPSAQTWLLDDDGKIKVERIISYVAPR